MRMSPACGRGWLSSAVRAGSSATFIYTKAMTQASFANAAEFFNSLLGDCTSSIQSTAYAKVGQRIIP
jgi:hypothetical protein